jgi:hypothetical protein
MCFGMAPPVALQTQSAHVAEIAFAATHGHGNDMVGIPQRFAALQAPGSGGFQASDATQSTEVSVFGDAISAAECANAFITFEDPLTQMGWVAAETPFFDAEGGTKGMTSSRHFKLAPAAEVTAVWAFGEGVFVGPAAFGQSALVAHKNRIAGKFPYRSLHGELGGGRSVG